MPETRFPPPLRVGFNSADGSGQGGVLVTQSALINQNSTNAVTVRFDLPAGARITDIIFDTITAWNSATSATGTVGTAAGGSQYAGGVSTTAAARVRPTFTGAQLGAFLLPAGGSVFATITPVGATSAGQTRVTINYETI